MRALPWSSELRGFFPKVAEAARLVVPFQRLEIGLLEGPSAIRVWALAGDGDPPAERVLPHPHAAPGNGSVLAVALQASGRDLGTLWLLSDAANAFTAAHAAAVRPVADLLAQMAGSDRLRAIEQDRRLRRDQLEPRLPAIAGALDVRGVLPGMSKVIRDVIPRLVTIPGRATCASCATRWSGR